MTMTKTPTSDARNNRGSGNGCSKKYYESEFWDSIEESKNKEDSERLTIESVMKEETLRDKIRKASMIAY